MSIPVLSSPWTHVPVSILSVHKAVNPCNLVGILVLLPLSGSSRASLTRSNTGAAGCTEMKHFVPHMFSLTDSFKTPKLAKSKMTSWENSSFLRGNHVCSSNLVIITLWTPYIGISFSKQKITYKILAL